jgi:hypothetical protein
MGRRGISLAVILLSAAMLLSLMPNNSSAFPYVIKGNLKDEDGNPIPHATLTLTGQVYNISSEQFEEASAVFTDATGGSGYYQITVGVDEPGGFSTGDVIVLAYSSDTGEVSSSFTLTGLGTWNNMTAEGKTSLLDSLFSPLGIAIIVIILFILIVAGYWFTSTEKDEDDITETARTKVGRRRR